MTFQDYHFYSDIAVKIFNFMNGYINTMNRECTLYIDMYDLIHGTYANIRYPNSIFIHIGTIIDSWDDDWGTIMDRSSYIASCIAWAISHELHHADQLISMVRYNNNKEYKESVEGDVERASYDWVANHSREIRDLIGIPIVITDIESGSLPKSGNYRKANIEQFYKQNIANIIIRDLNLFSKLEVFTNDSITDDIILTFNGIDSVIIKSNGRYLRENISAFSSIVYKYSGYFDTYHIKIETKTDNINGKNIANVNFIITDALIYPMIF